MNDQASGDLVEWVGAAASVGVLGVPWSSRPSRTPWFGEALMALQVHDTTDHDEIRLWIQRHHGAPARVSDPAATRAADVLLVDFLGVRPGHGFERIS
ncbi:hypothetical protein MPY17_39650 (plasmid) [Rhodococcus opacus]|uniref:hypothetical protein n=1 Tax=Rhodococcus opacus TaxID=37919 RepID=UPI001FF22B9D|nr:hypothetical protein [Rhodococcus opacus]UOT08512.1 hypothetical protein MPY17_39650 [Rhodococcus opacus]